MALTTGDGRAKLRGGGCDTCVQCNRQTQTQTRTQTQTPLARAEELAH